MYVKKDGTRRKLKRRQSCCTNWQIAPSPFEQVCLTIDQGTKEVSYICRTLHQRPHLQKTSKPAFLACVTPM
eukprot:4445829-Amphidinium_carterae.1